VAGDRLEEAVAACRRLEQAGICATLDHLGENVTTLAEAQQSLAEGRAALERIRSERLPATVSIKLTQYGLDLSEQACRANVSALVEQAQAADSRVEVDMESTEYTDRTLSIVSDLHRRHPGRVRAVIQAYLYRSEKDVESLTRQGVSVRLCKGAYLEGPEVAFESKQQVDANYRKLMARLLVDGGVYPAIATHDEAMLGEAYRVIDGNKIAPDRFEFQMLYGIRRDLQADIVRRGYRLRIYVPYGVAWYPYFMRRLAERPANVWFVLKNIGRD
jgi:proline dehydrogenase